MDRSKRGIEEEIVEILKQMEEGKIDKHTTSMKIARRILEQSECENMLQSMIAIMIMNGETQLPGLTMQLLNLKIIRLEDDVCKLRAELVRGRIKGKGEAE